VGSVARAYQVINVVEEEGIPSVHHALWDAGPIEDLEEAHRETTLS